MSLVNYRFHTNSTKAWGAMLRAIMQAKESIYLEMYIFENDTLGYDFLAELINKAKSGIKVILLLDALGSIGLAKARSEELIAVGGEVIFFSKWFRRTHRKILIVDEKILFVGGVNIAHRFALWHDLQVEIKGKRIAKIAINSFARMYIDAGGNNPIMKLRTSNRFVQRAKIWFLERGVKGIHRGFRPYYESHINNAQRHITLVTPYLLPRRWLLAILHKAILRNVTVEIFVPQYTDIPIMDRINRHYLLLLEEMGAHCFLLPKMNHAKMMMIDEQEGIVGSQNIDILSFDLNAEASLFFNEETMIKELSSIILQWKEDALEFSSNTKWHWYDNVISFVLKIFHPLL